MWELQPDPEVTQRIDAQRLAGKSDDDVVARLILAATGRRSVVSATREVAPVRSRPEDGPANAAAMVSIGARRVPRDSCRSRDRAAYASLVSSSAK